MLEYTEKSRQLSGYKINWNKLELLGLTEQTYQALLSRWDFPWSPIALKHPGILIPRDLKQTAKINLDLIIRQIINALVKGDLAWLLGKIGIMKNNVLIRFAYKHRSLLFQSRLYCLETGIDPKAAWPRDPRASNT